MLAVLKNDDIGWRMRPPPNAQPNQSLIDGIRTLQALASAQEPVGCRELGRQLGLHSTKVNRLLRTLAHLGIARQTAGRKYTAGPGMHVLAAQSLFASGLLQRALPHLQALRRFGHTVAMGVLWTDQVSYLFHAPPGIEATGGLGRIGLLPATTSGIGMMLLSKLPDEDVRDLYQGMEIPQFPGGIDELENALAVIRNNEFARVHVADDRNHHIIAIPIGEPVYAGIAMSGWIPETATDDIVCALREAAQGIA
jgi:DNA-binding IclR family transcriptional regulator